VHCVLSRAEASRAVSGHARIPGSGAALQALLKPECAGVISPPPSLVAASGESSSAKGLIDFNRAAMAYLPTIGAAMGHDDTLAAGDIFLRRSDADRVRGEYIQSAPLRQASCRSAYCESTPAGC
jgi:hypothetical protein